MRFLCWLYLHALYVFACWLFIPRPLLLRYQVEMKTASCRWIAVLVYLTPLLSLWRPLALAPWLIPIGGLLMAAGGALAIAAQRVNPWFSPLIKRPPFVVRVGVYRHIRHPAYLGWSALVLGAWLICPSVYGAICGLAYVSILFSRAILEDIEIADSPSISLQ